jgi:hypothetical protein
MLTGTDLLTIERTLQLAIAPAFILGGIMALLALLTARLQRVAELHEQFRQGARSELHDPRRLVRRARLGYRAVTCAIIAAVLLCVLVIAAFVEPLAGVTVGAHVAGLLLSAMLFLTLSLVFLLCEVLVSAAHLPLRHEP